MRIQIILSLVLVLIASTFASEIDEIDHEIWDLMDSAVKYFGEGYTWYDIFGVEYDAPSAEIQKIYRKRSLEYHPDKNPGEEAASKFLALAGMAKILKHEEKREKYHYWLENGIPYWRGQKYYYFYRNSEDLSLLSSILLILGGFSVMQYIAQLVGYFQLKHGLKLLEKQRSLERTTPKKARQEMKKRRISPSIQQEDQGGIFDDANIKKAVQYLVFQKKIDPDIILDQVAWNELIKKKRELLHHQTKHKSIIDPPIPNPWNTLLIFKPIHFLLKFLEITTSSDDDDNTKNNDNKKKIS